MKCHNCDTSISSDNGNQLKIIHKISERSMKSRTYSNQPYWELHTYFGKYKVFNIGNNMSCAINCNCRMVATLYTLQIYIYIFIYFRYIIISAMNKYDKK